MQERGHSKIIFTKFIKYSDLHASLLNINDICSITYSDKFLYLLPLTCKQEGMFKGSQNGLLTF